VTRSTKAPLATRACAALFLTVLAMLVMAPAGRAATAGLWYGTLYYVAGPGEANNLTVSSTTDHYVISDPAANVSPGYGCTAIDVHGVSCPSKYVSGLYLKTGDLNDTISLLSLTPATVDCGDGTDALNTPSANARPTNCENINVPATPPATPPVAPPALPPVSIGQSVATMTAGGQVPLTLSCSAAAPCTGTLVLERVKTAKSSGATASRRGAPNILGKEKLSLAQGKKRRVTVSMSSAGRRMVKRHRKLRVTAKLTITQGGKTTTTTQSLTIKAPH
jgi:hypothetical protein